LNGDEKNSPDHCKGIALTQLEVEPMTTEHQTLTAVTESGPNLWPRWPPAISPLPVEENTLPGALTLAPFCYDLTSVLALYRAGGKVIAANADPLPLLAAKARLTPINAETLTTTFTHLGDTLKHGQTLRQHIESLYQTTCPDCQTRVLADYFIWRTKEADPEHKWIACPHCNFIGLAPVSKADLNLLDAIETRGLHYHFLLERAASPGAPARARLEKLHELYTPRTIYAIAEIIMKIEAAITDQDVQRVFKAVLLDCLPYASNLFNRLYPTHLPNQLRPPVVFLERNVWRLFEERVTAWQPPTLPPRLAPRLDDLLQRDQNSIHFFPHSPAHLKPHLPTESVSLALTVPPAPNPTLWALSVMWSGWLLGLKHTESRHALLTQKWPNWPWYQQTLTTVMKALRPALKPEATWIFAFESIALLQAPTITLAVLSAGFGVEDWQIAETYHQITLTLAPLTQPSPTNLAVLEEAIQTESHTAIQGFLQEHGQPASKSRLFLAAWQSLLYSGLLAQALVSLPGEEVLTWLSDQIDRTQINADFR
jgi:hypothetical protein